MASIIAMLAGGLVSVGLLVAQPSLAADKNTQVKPVTPNTAPAQAPIQAPTPAPKPSLPAQTKPAIPKDALGANRNLDAIRDANAMRDMRRLEELEQIFGSPLDRGRRPAEPAATNPLERHGIGTGTHDTPPQPGGASRDCLDNPADCLQRGASGGSGGGDRLGGPPRAGGGVPSRSGWASEGEGGATGRLIDRLGQQGTSTSFGPMEDSEGNSTSTGTIDYENGDITQEQTNDSEGNHERTRIISHDDGSEIVENHTDHAVGGSSTYYSERDANGSGTWITVHRDADGRVVGGEKGFIRNGRHGPALGAGGASGSAGQPSEAPDSSGNNDGCDWAPLHGCLRPREDLAATIKGRISQPSLEQGGEGSARSRTGVESVINTEGVEPRGGTGGADPYDPRDPEGIVPGPGAPGHRPAADAGIDASMGALPTPPE